MPLTSMPRAATSVATSASMRPASKRDSAFVRCAWDLFPCIAATWMPRPASFLASRSAPPGVLRGERVRAAFGAEEDESSAATIRADLADDRVELACGRDAHETM